MMQGKDMQRELRDFIWNMCRQQEKVNYYGLARLAFPEYDDERIYQVVQEMKRAIKGKAG